jgi:hypothetical protein
MANEETLIGTELDSTVEIELEDPATETTPDDGADGSTDDPAAGDGVLEDDSLVITLDDGNEVPEDEEDDDDKLDPTAPDWVKKTRAVNKELNKSNRELKKQLDEMKSQSQSAPAAEIPLPEKPTLESCGYDTDLFEEKFVEWNELKKTVTAKQQAAKVADEQLQAAFNAKLATYNTKKTTVKIKDFDASEAAVKVGLDLVKQGILVDICDDPHSVVAVLGKNPTKLKELSEITNPLQFVKALAQLEAKIKVAPKVAKKAPVDSAVRGSTGGSMSDARLDQLRADADKSGDRTKVIAYIRAKGKK